MNTGKLDDVSEVAYRAALLILSKAYDRAAGDAESTRNIGFAISRFGILVSHHTRCAHKIWPKSAKGKLNLAP